MAQGSCRRARHGRAQGPPLHGQAAGPSVRWMVGVAPGPGPPLHRLANVARLRVRGLGKEAWLANLESARVTVR